MKPAVRALSTVTLFLLFAGDFWRDFIGWPAYLALAGVLAVINAIWLIRGRPSVPLSRWPKTLLLFVGFAVVSIAWSHYREWSVLGALALIAAGVGGLAPALLLSWQDVLKVLGSALRWVIGLSAVFELVVALIVRHPILPLVHQPGGDYSGKVPDAFYWSRDALFHGGPIQGIVGNGDLLAMCAVIALIVFALQLADGQGRRWSGIAWIVLAAAELLLSHSATSLVAAFGTAVVAGFALWGRSIPQHRRWPLYGTAIAVLVVGVGGVLTQWHAFTHLLGKSADLTGRTDIWGAVIEKAQEHPIFGWGWISYWSPWVAPFKGLAVRHGVQYLQAHDAWLDVWLQLGIVGVVLFGMLVLSTIGRSWFHAVDRPVRGAADAHGAGRYRAVALLPLLVVAALAIQSVAESRLLVESGWMLLVLASIKTKADRA